MTVNYDLASEGGMKVFGDGGEDSAGVVQFKTGAAGIPTLTLGRTANSDPTVGTLKILGTSAASAAVMQFGGGFISCTSILLTSVAAFDYVLPVYVGNVMRAIPLIGLASIGGAAAF